MRRATGAVVAACAVVLAACSGGGAAPSGGAAASSLVVGATSDPDTLFPWKATQFQAVNVLEQLYGTLTELDADLEVVPGLAESWEVSEDGTTVTFTLREGVTFADGSAFDSADVKASLDRIRDEATGAVARASLESVASVEAPDPRTVVLTLTGPDAGLLAALASVNLAILPSDATEEALQATPNGTGPFTLTQRTPNQSIVLEPNPNFWGGAPKVPSLEFRVIPDETSIVAAMQSGNVSFAVFDDPLVAQSAEGSGLTVTKTPQLSYHVLQLNARRAPLDNLDVRLAIQCAIDRQQVLDTAALGEGEVTGPITSPAYRSDPAARPCPQRDLDAAKRHLAAAGHAGGLTLSTIVSQGEYATSVNEATNIQAQLAEAGITLNLEVLESGAYVDRWVAADFETAVALNGGRPDPDGMYGRYFTSTGNLNEVAGYSSPELDALFAQGKATSDPEARKAIYQEVSRHLEDNAVWVWLFTSYTYTATGPEVSGFTPMANGSLKFLRETTVGGS
ncbi:MAG TPA: ABC transporter substrate-binding protein [Pseudonocardia sp.]|uniref:ABC transporter substrate-binding protein n=1 Tax=Pseudonocardia sp. TaxID=60912 RepID=UPI002B4AEEB0|nr:ABC transporter substrate-binding protein [Pseudonocardia sp.]HLU55310.1 ABC transporter substrate-binding protein [Pseudonocardia sp.]